MDVNAAKNSPVAIDYLSSKQNKNKSCSNPGKDFFVVLHYYHIGAIYVTSFFVTDCMTIKQLGTQLMVQSSH